MLSKFNMVILSEADLLRPGGEEAGQGPVGQARGFSVSAGDCCAKPPCLRRRGEGLARRAEHMNSRQAGTNSAKSEVTFRSKYNEDR